jgi:hypothetical protein
MKGMIVRRIAVAILGICLVLSYAAIALPDDRTARDITPDEKIKTEILEEKVSEFQGNPWDKVTFEGKKKFSSMDMFVYSTNEGRFYVNPKTERVEGAFLKNMEKLFKNSQSMGDYEKISEQFAKTKYPNFTSRNMVLTDSAIIDHGNAGNEYLFIWSELIGEAVTQNSVKMSYIPKRDILSYIGIERPVTIDTKPTITREEATEKAINVFGTLPSPSINSKLRVISYGKTQRLVWDVVILSQSDTGFSLGGSVLIDAVDGTVLFVNPYQ